MKKFLLSIFAVLFAFAGAQAQTWTKVTDASTLKAGDEVVIVASKFNFALSTTQNTNNRAQAAVTKDGDNVTFGDDVQILTLESGKTAGTFAFNTGSGYLYAASSSKNYLKTEKTLSANSSWKITIDNEIATIKAVGSNTRNWLRYNSSNNPPIFSCYSSNQADVSLYRKEISGGEDTKTVSPPTFDPADGAIFTGATLPVTISTATEGATIHYTINDGAEQTGASPVSVNVTETTTTIVAYATLDGYENSANSTATYTKVTPISIAEARAACTTNGVAVVMDLSGAQVIGVGGSNMFVQKEGVGICLYQSSPKYKLGDVFAEGSYVAGSAKNYGGLHELADYTITTSGVTNSEIEKNVVSFSDVTVENSCTYITLENVTVDGSNLVSGENSLAYYDTFKYINGSTLPTTSCTVTGVLSVYSNNLQILPLEIVAGPALLPTLSVEGGNAEGEAVEVYLNSALTIIPAEGSSVTYTMGANSATVTEETEILFDSEGAVALTIAVEQKFYTPVEKTYYYNVVEANIPCTVSFSANGVVVGTETVNLGGSLATAPEVSVPEGLELIGWTEDEKTMELVEFPYLVNSDITLYAVYSVTSEGGTSWNLVEDVNDINAGDEIIIAAATKNVALGKINSNYHTSVDIARSGNVLTSVGDAIVLTVGKNVDSYTFSYDSKYLNWTSSNSLTTATSISENTSWAIEIATDGVATISNKKDVNRILQFNPSSPRFACYTSSQQKVRIYKKTELVVTTTSYYTLSVSAAGYATMYLGFAAAIPEGVKAYIVKEEGINDTYISLTQVEGVLPVETGVIVEAKEGEYLFYSSSNEAADVTGNLLEGSVTDEYVAGNAYVLGNKDGIGLYKAVLNKNEAGEAGTTHFKNNANKAYLPASVASGAASYSFRFGEGTTGIDQITDNRVQSTEIFDLTGRRVENISAPGIYVVNGKKVLVK